MHSVTKSAHYAGGLVNSAHAAATASMLISASGFPNTICITSKPTSAAHGAVLLSFESE